MTPKDSICSTHPTNSGPRRTRGVHQHVSNSDNWLKGSGLRGKGSHAKGLQTQLPHAPTLKFYILDLSLSELLHCPPDFTV